MQEEQYCCTARLPAGPGTLPLPLDATVRLPLPLRLPLAPWLITPLPPSSLLLLLLLLQVAALQGGMLQEVAEVSGVIRSLRTPRVMLPTPHTGQWDVT